MDELPPDMTDTDAPEKELSQEELTALLKRLKAEHRSVDMEIKALYETGVTDVLKIKRMKKIKLSMKDKIAFIENELTPDIIA